jgi:flagellar basal-body rod modification protein FlgD
MSSSISAVASNPGSLYNTDSAPGSAKALNQNDFLTLLVKQIQFQDPMNPKSNTDMAAQMAQFTSLQQAAQSSSSLQMMQASSLIGTQVTLQVDNKTLSSGVVTGLTMKNGTPQILVDGSLYNLNQILTVSPPPAPTTTNPTATTAN